MRKPNYYRVEEKAVKVLEKNYLKCPPIDVLMIAENEGLSVKEIELN